MSMAFSYTQPLFVPRPQEQQAERHQQQQQQGSVAGKRPHGAADAGAAAKRHKPSPGGDGAQQQQHRKDAGGGAAGGDVGAELAFGRIDLPDDKRRGGAFSKKKTKTAELLKQAEEAAKSKAQLAATQEGRVRRAYSFVDCLRASVAAHSTCNPEVVEEDIGISPFS